MTPGVIDGLHGGQTPATTAAAAKVIEGLSIISSNSKSQATTLQSIAVLVLLSFFLNDGSGRQQTVHQTSSLSACLVM